MKCNMPLKLHFLDSHPDFFLRTWEKLVMNTVKYFPKTFPSWTKGSWEDGRVLSVNSERTPRKWLQKKKFKKDILKLSTRKEIFIESVKILCIND